MNKLEQSVVDMWARPQMTISHICSKFGLKRQEVLKVLKSNVPNFENYAGQLGVILGNKQEPYYRNEEQYGSLYNGYMDNSYGLLVRNYSQEIASDYGSYGSPVCCHSLQLSRQYTHGRISKSVHDIDRDERGGHSFAPVHFGEWLWDELVDYKPLQYLRVQSKVGISKFRSLDRVC
jgi:hypothetical protein